MANMWFDTTDPAHVDGEFTDVAVLDRDHNPNLVLESSKGWSIEVGWKIFDTDPTRKIVGTMGGEWSVQALVESIGQGFEGQVGATQTVNLSNTQAGSTPTSLLYKTTIDVPANWGDPTLSQDGAYLLVVLINYKNINGQRMPIAGFDEGPVIQFYTP